MKDPDQTITDIEFMQTILCILAVAIFYVSTAVHSLGLSSDRRHFVHYVMHHTRMYDVITAISRTYIVSELTF